MLATAGSAGLPVVGVVVLAAYAPGIERELDRMGPAAAALLVMPAGIVLSGMALLPTHAVSLAMGWLFGGTIGSLLAWLTVAGAAMVGHGFGTRLAGPSSRWLDPTSRIARVRAAVLESSDPRAGLLIALLRLSPAAPFAATNVALAAVGVKRSVFLVGSVIGLAPRVFVVAWLGAGMSRLDLTRPTSPPLLAVGVLATIAVLVGVGSLARAALRRTLADHAPAGSTHRSGTTSID